MELNLPRKIVQEALSFWEEQGAPLLRSPTPNDRIIILGQSQCQDKFVLLDRELQCDDEYTESANAVLGLISIDIPSEFTCGTEIVAEISTSFTDSYGDWLFEITFNEEWHATLLQSWFDTKNLHLCIQETSSAKNQKMFEEHASIARYAIDTTIRHAALQHMGIRNKIGQYIAQFWQSHGELPKGQHTVDGTVIIFPAKSQD
jgi:hypothetical protein